MQVPGQYGLDTAAANEMHNLKLVAGLNGSIRPDVAPNNLAVVFQCNAIALEFKGVD